MLVGWGVLVAGCAGGMPLVAGPYALSVLTEAMVAVLFAASLHFMMGPGGMPSFGHAAWFGIGALRGGVVGPGARPRRCRWGFLLAPHRGRRSVAALFGAFVVQAVRCVSGHADVGVRADRLGRGVSNGSAMTGGDNGILGIWPPPWASGPAAYYLLASRCCAGAARFPAAAGPCLTLRLCAAGRRGTRRCGRRRSGSTRSASGWPAFVIAGAAAGLSGAVFAYQKGSVFPGFVSIPRSVDALLMVLLGARADHGRADRRRAGLYRPL